MDPGIALHERAVPSEYWHALRVRSNFETTAARLLRGKGIVEFLPTCQRRQQWSDRWKLVDFPLFPGYLFCRLNTEARQNVICTPGVVSIVSFGDRPAIVPDSEIESIRAICLAGLPYGPYPFLREGESIRITEGPLKGVEGQIVRIKSKARLVVSITLLQRSVAVELDRETVAPA